MTWFAVGGAVAGAVISSKGAKDAAKIGADSGFRDLTTITEEQLQIDEAGLDKIIADILGSEKGLANIFSAENIAGIFDTTVAAQASGDLMVNLAGELAKLTASTRREETEVGETGGAGVAAQPSILAGATSGAALGSTIGETFS